jgi:hypothetical protein
VKKEASGRRSIQVEVEVPGMPEEVWQAITTAGDEIYPSPLRWVLLGPKPDSFVGGFATKRLFGKHKTD